MPEPTVRDQIKRVLEELPPDATFEDAIERLVFLAKIDAGLAGLDAGQGLSHDEAKRRDATPGHVNSFGLGASRAPARLDLRGQLPA